MELQVTMGYFLLIAVFLLMSYALMNRDSPTDSKNTSRSKSSGSASSGSASSGSYSNNRNLESYFFHLGIKLMKADGFISESEKAYLKKYMAKMFGDEKTNDLFQGDSIGDFEKMIAENPTLANPTLEFVFLRKYIKKEGWFSIIQFLYGLSASDGRISSSEDSFIKMVGAGFNFSEYQIRQIRNLFIAPKNNSKKESPEMILNLGILGLKPGVSITDIKSAYRSMAKEFHPDKLASLSEGIQNLGKEKFQSVLKAYDYLKSNYQEPA